MPIGEPLQALALRGREATDAHGLHDRDIRTRIAAVARPVRLSLNVRTVRRKAEGDIELAMDLTARGAAGLVPMDRWFDRAHHAIVQAFADLTGGEMHRDWGRKEGA